MSWKGHWSTQQLAEFLAAVFSYSHEEAAIRGALERAVEALDAELGVIVRGSALVASVGFGLAGPPEGGLRTETGGAVTTIDGLGLCATASVPIEDSTGGVLSIGRLGDEPFAAEELHLLGNMARVLALTLVKLGVLEQERALRERSERQAEENVRLLARLQERQRLFERLSRIQRSISHLAELDSVIDAIIAGAAELLGDEVLALRLIDPEDASATVVASSRGLPPDLIRSLRHARVGEGAGGRAIAERRLIVMQHYGTEPGAMPDFAGAGNLRAAMAAPVRHGEVVGSLTVGTRNPERSTRRPSRRSSWPSPSMQAWRSPTPDGRGHAPSLPRLAHRPRQPRPLPRPWGAQAARPRWSARWSRWPSASTCAWWPRESSAPISSRPSSSSAASSGRASTSLAPSSPRR